MLSVSFPRKSHPTKLADVRGNKDIEVNFYFILLGIDLRVNMQSLKMAPPEFRLIIQSMSLAISNSCNDFTHAFYLNLTSS